ncbi:hypothetical protein AMECASPLE_029523 [Ameca splendens]|uniref:CASP-like protein n=1 Tax=Ameca splendens TaxID=208324 RepID=A0ABV0YU05_9TELE
MIHNKEAESEAWFYGFTGAVSAGLAHLISVAFSVFIAFLSRPGTSECAKCLHPFNVALRIVLLIFNPACFYFRLVFMASFPDDSSCKLNLSCKLNKPQHKHPCIYWDLM